MPHGIVDVLEMIQVDGDNGKTLGIVIILDPHFFRQRLQEQGAVRQPC